MEVYGNWISGMLPKYESESNWPSSQGAIFEIEFFKIVYAVSLGTKVESFCTIR
jgi:hypothetical protein